MKSPRGIPLKQFLSEEAQRLNCCPATIQRRMNRGDYVGKILVFHKTKRTVLVNKIADLTPP